MAASSDARVKVPLEPDGWTVAGWIRASQGWIRAPSCLICCADVGASGAASWQRMGRLFLGPQRRGAQGLDPRSPRRFCGKRSRFG